MSYLTKAEAHRLLDAAQRGEPVTQLQIIDALRATGDLGPLHLCSRAPEAHRTQPTPEEATA